MKKTILILVCFFSALIMSCGGDSETEGGTCVSNFDCPIGQTCSNGRCAKPGSSDDGSGEGGSGEGGGSDGGSGSHDGGGSGSNDGDESTDDSDIEYDDGPITGDCEPGKVQKCEYQGLPSTENVGPCKSASRTCGEEGKWGKCKGEVLPVAENTEELCTNGIDDDCDGTADNGTSCSYWNDNVDTGDPTGDTSDSGVIDVGYTGDYSDAYQLPTDIDMDNICTDTCVPLKAECLPNDIEEGEIEGLCNGLDDDCDGKVDEGCDCAPGQTQACFLGPKNYRNKGTCHDGVQTCKVTMRAAKGVWGDCVGGISPKQDVCDNADNNCNGCDDDKLCCAPPINCAYDLTADGDFLPFKYKIIDGKQIYDTGHKFNDADTATWEWTLTKGPCDIVLNKVNSYVKGGKTAAEVGDVDTDNGTASTVVSGVGFSQFKVKFRLSGNYKLHLKVTRENGEVYECEWVITVVSDGLRIELCWDKTGPSTSGGRDIDLYLGKNGKTSAWRTGSCYYGNCTTTSVGTYPSWGYDTTENYDKNGKLKTMKNPRLDMDNISTVGEPENINLDNPKDGDTFRVMVHHYSGTKTDETHPVVNVYCGGTLKATYGVEPQVTGFKDENDSWKVVEIKWVGDYSSDACELTPVWNNGYVTNNAQIPEYTNW